MATNKIPVNPNTPVASIRRATSVTGSLLQADLERTTAMLKREMAPLMEETNRTIGEEDFIALFLPLFAGDFQRDREKFTLAISAWHKVAGSHYQAVHVVKNGRVVATVPPLHNNNLSAVPQPNGRAVRDIFVDAIHAASFRPELGSESLRLGLKQRFLDNGQRSDMTPERKKWYDLLAHYGRAPTNWNLPETATPALASKTAPNDNDDGLVYD